ncbi:unnamed protein product [Prunus armeniaca]
MATISLLILHPSHIWTLLLTRKKEKKATKTTQDGKRSSANLIRLKVSNKRAAAGDRSKNERKAARKDSRKAAPRTKNVLKEP